MPLDVGMRIGAYEIVSLLGKGGMGEVYVANDPRLGRQVAIKILPELHSCDPDRLRRFEQEAQAAAHINHAGILSIFDIGREQDIPYIVTELLDGESLRARMQPHAPISWRKCVDIAIQTADALASAHRNGIVHRDIKPENLFVTRDGRVKILDFGLAKLLYDQQTGSQVDTQSYATAEGVVVGTAGYMSPEQVKGMPADERTDIFSMGAVLFEMLTGIPAFQGEGLIERIASILHHDPPLVSEMTPSVPPSLGRMVRRCLQKDPDRRFQSIRDLAFALEEILLSGDQTSTPQQPATYRRLTFRKGYVWTARFAPDGHTILYGGCWDGAACSLYMTRNDTTESLQLAMPPADILSVSKNGEMLICLNRSFEIGYTSSGTLARVPMIGGAPRPIMENVQEADWLPNGRDIAVVRHMAGEYILEFPMGNRVYRTSGWISNARVSRNGEWVAFLDHPLQGDDSGYVAIVDRSGNKRTLTKTYGSMQGCAWAGDDIWFSGSDSYINREIYGVTVSGETRWVLRIPASLTLHDISPAGDVLLTHDSMCREMIMRTAEGKHRNLSWLNWSLLRDISPDGQWALFQEQAGGMGGNAVCIRKLDGSPAIQLGDGFSTTFTDDGKWVVSLLLNDSNTIQLLPTGPLAPRTIKLGDLRCNWAGALKSKNKLLISGRKPSQNADVLYIMGLSGGTAEQISDEPLLIPKTFSGSCIAPTGDAIAGWDYDRNLKIVPLNGTGSFLLPGLRNHLIAGWTPDGAAILTYRPEGSRISVARVEIQTGNVEAHSIVEPSDPAGIAAISPIVYSRGLDHYLFSYRRILSDLYIARDLK